jgi:hypothetical protein
MSAIRTYARAAGAAMLAAIVAGCSDSGGGGFARHEGATPIAGTFTATDEAIATEPISAERARVTITFTRTGGLPDLETLTPCPDPPPVDGDKRYSVSFEFEDDGQYEAVVINELGDGKRCYQLTTGEYRVDGEVIRTNGDASFTFTRHAAADTVTLVVDVAAPPEVGVVDLSQGDALDGLNGTWALTAAADHTLVIAEHPEHIAQELVRQVGAPGDAEVPVPTRCHWIQEADAYSVNQLEGVDDLQLAYDVDTVRLVDDGRNDPGCVAFAARQTALANSGSLPVRRRVALTRGELVLDGVDVYVRQ